MIAWAAAFVVFLAVMVGPRIPQANAIVIINSQPVFDTTSDNIPGQSLTTPAGGPWNNLQFYWFDDTGAPSAFGTLFILTQEYTGEPLSLSPATFGYVTSVLANGPGTFYPPSPVIELQPSTTYYFYANAFPPDPIRVATTDPLALGTAYEGASPFVAVPGNDFAFDLTGVVVPEPSTVVLVVLGLLGMGYRRKKRA